MSRGRTFDFKMSTTGEGALRERVHKSVYPNQSKVRAVLTYGVTTNLAPSEPSIYRDGVFISMGYLMEEEGLTPQEFQSMVKRKNLPLYYTGDKLSYVLVQRITMERGTITANTVSIYLPYEVNNKGLYCKDVTLGFSKETRNALADSLINFAKSKISK